MTWGYIPVMPIPAFDEAGFLPEGGYDCLIEEIRDRFGTFQSTDRRAKLFEGFAKFVVQVWQVDAMTQIVIDGSFVTATAYPNDIDLTVMLGGGHDFSAELWPFEYNCRQGRPAESMVLM